ncbi:hypothetical protein GQ464_012220 [Rhodocaloribacter litoris]|uniref:DUF6036 family nucleotidyltransferase n=1 Tax=Rhodocaloribacter litoris TaxID=2558931 RepID=UPI00142252C9|nr:DUF6036 family nucleotidyltransferase [Rhodocaloribacter litoris]QXD14212.1 hypothetical protein GQ464_012220 [Rhodocaloribacter litoris]
MTAFEKLLVDLSRSDVAYILVGGLAVTLNGYARATEDVDILVQASPLNLQRLLNVLADFGEGHARQLTIDDFTLEEGCIRIIESFPLDIFTLMSGHTYEDLLPYTALHHVQDVPIRYLTAEGLIRLKSGSLRPKDQLDVQALRDIQRRHDP